MLVYTNVVTVFAEIYMNEFGVISVSIDFCLFFRFECIGWSFAANIFHFSYAHIQTSILRIPIGENDQHSFVECLLCLYLVCLCEKLSSTYN